MAEAKSTTIEKQVTEKKQVPAITLTLSIEEAEALQALVGRVSGSTYASPRKHTDAIYIALDRAGVSTYAKPVSRQIEGSLRWLVEPKAKSPRF
ncbi:hypothetical protein [Streptomyces sp. NPDC002324]